MITSAPPVSKIPMNMTVTRYSRFQKDGCTDSGPTRTSSPTPGLALPARSAPSVGKLIPVTPHRTKQKHLPVPNPSQTIQSGRGLSHTTSTRDGRKNYSQNVLTCRYPSWRNTTTSEQTKPNDRIGGNISMSRTGCPTMFVINKKARDEGPE